MLYVNRTACCRQGFVSVFLYGVVKTFHSTPLNTMLIIRAEEHPEIRREISVEMVRILSLVLKRAELQGTATTKEYLKTSQANLLDVAAIQP